jgi:hypothetical protein
MDYYQRIAKASEEIKEKAEKGYPFKAIENYIFIKYGFSRKFVERELERYANLNFFEFEDGKIILPKKVEKEEVEE